MIIINSTSWLLCTCIIHCQSRRMILRTQGYPAALRTGMVGKREFYGNSPHTSKSPPNYKQTTRNNLNAYKTIHNNPLGWKNKHRLCKCYKTQALWFRNITSHYYSFSTNSHSSRNASKSSLQVLNIASYWGIGSYSRFKNLVQSLKEDVLGHYWPRVLRLTSTLLTQCPQASTHRFMSKKSLQNLCSPCWHTQIIYTPKTPQFGCVDKIHNTDIVRRPEAGGCTGTRAALILLTCWLPPDTESPRQRTSTPRVQD